MHSRPAHHGEASSLPVGAVACVRLRISTADRLLAVLRWTLGLAGAVVVLWLGSAFLMASPAAAAVPAVAVQAGLAKGGHSRPAAATDDGSNSDSGSSGDGGDDSGGDSEGGDSEGGDSGGDSEGDSGESNDESDSEERSGDEDEARSEDREEELSEERSEEESDSSEKAEEEAASEQERRADDDAAEQPADDEDAAEEQRTGEENSTEQRADEQAATEHESAEDTGELSATEQNDSDQDGEQAARELDSDQEAVDEETVDEQSVGDERADEQTGSEPDTAEDGQGVDVRAALDDAADTDGSRSDAEEAAWEQLITAELEADGQDADTRQAMLRAGETADSRGPPGETIALLNADDSADDGADEDDREDESRESEDGGEREDDQEYDDSPELTERVLEGRIDVDNSREELEHEQQKLAAGATTQADYDERAAEHVELEQRAAEDRAELSPDRVELVDEVVDGHRELSEREQQLAAEEEQVAAGEVDRDTHERNVADFEEQRVGVYEATDELMDATHRDVRLVSDEDLEGEGAAAGCGSDGAFVECGSVSESSDGEQDSDRCVALSGVSGCGASSSSGQSKAEASCDDSGCGSSASSRGADGTESRASARCDGDARGCGQSSTATPESASAACESGGGSCRSDSSGSGRGHGAPLDSSERRTAASASCTGDCAAETHADRSRAEASCDTDGGTCDSASSGSGTDRDTVRLAGAAPVRETSGSSSCTATAGGCSAESASEVGDSSASQKSRSARNAATRELFAASAAGATVACALEGCTGTGNSATSGAASGDVPGVRDSTGSSSCTAHGAGGTCSAASDTVVSDREPSPGETVAGVIPVSGPVSVSNANASVECTGAATECGGTATSATSARDTAVTPDARGTSASTECTVTGGGCDGTTSSAASSAGGFVTTDPNTGLPLPGRPTSGPSSTATANASLVCAPGATCTGSVRTSTAAWDGAVTRTADSTTSCTGATGGCEVRSVSTASSGPGAALALAGGSQQVNATRLPAGPSAASAAGAALTCEIACTGSVSSAATGTDPSVSPSPRGSHGEGSCEGVTGGVCQAVTNSGASSGPDANVIAPLVAERSTANATVSSGTTGEGPDQQQPEQGQPAVPAPTAPGSWANSGAPTVPGASSWSMANATLDCAGSTSCAGTARSFAAGSDGPATMNTATGARGPPGGGSTTSGSCATGATGCRAQTSATAGSGQVVADIIAEDQISTAVQLAEQAAQAEYDAALAAQIAGRADATAEQKKAAADAVVWAEQARVAASEAAELVMRPVTGAPATMSRATASARCTGPDCVAATTGRTAGVPGGSHTAATCTAAASGCAVISDASAATGRDSGELDEAGTPIPGTFGSGQTSSFAMCPDVGCTATLSGGATAGDGIPSRSTAAGDTACTGASACMAEIEAGAATTASPAAGPDERFATSSAFVNARCDDGSTTGCATRTSSTTDVTGAGDGAVHGRSSAACTASGGCLATSGGTSVGGFAETTAGCAGAGCRTETVGTASMRAPGGLNRAEARTDCTAGADGGGCAAAGRVAVTTGAAQASTSCWGAAGSVCQQSYAASSMASGTAGGTRVSADAGCGAAGAAGAGWCATSAVTDVGAGLAMASAACEGSTTCSHSYRAESHARAAGAKGDAVGYGGAGAGGGHVMTTASATGGPGFAAASASCAGTAGARCSHSYSASASRSASYQGPGPDGSTVRHWARASASGSGGGGQGGGGVAVSAHASAGPTGASAGASCSGARNCSASFESHSVANAYHDPKHYAHADADCSGSGSGGFCATSAVARADARSASAGSSCAGNAGASCRFSYSAHSDADLDSGHETVTGGADCGDSGGFGGGGCGTVAYTEVDENGVTLLHLACEGPGCRYSGVGDAYAGNLIAQGGAHQQCGQVGEGSCTIGIKAELEPDREKENFSVDSFGYCVGTAGSNCQGGYWTHIDLGPSTVGDCSGVGSGGCHSETQSGKGDPVLSYGTCIEGMACDWTATTHSDAGLQTADKKLSAEANADCTTTNAAGTGGCVSAAGLEVQGNEIVGFASCEGGVGPNCRYHAHTTANDVNGMNTADAGHTCGQQAAGFCGVSSYAGALTDINLDGRPMAHHGEAIAGGTCTGSAGTECSGHFRTHVDSDRDTRSDCEGSGPGSCHGVADPWNAHSTFTPVLGTVSGRIESVSPDEHRSEDFSSATSPATVGANTHETVGRWFINFGRGAGDAVVALPEGVVQGVKDIGTHFGNFGRAAFGGEKFDRLPGESEEQYNARVWPLKHQWNQSMDMIGKIASGKAGRDLYWEPVATVSTAISGPSMILSAGVGTLVTKAFVKSLARLPTGRRHPLSGQAVPGNTGTAPGVTRPNVPAAVPPATRPDASTPTPPQPVVPSVPGDGQLPNAPTSPGAGTPDAPDGRPALPDNATVGHDGPLEGQTEIMVNDPDVTGRTITDIDHVEGGVLWEEKSATTAQNIDNWVSKHIDRKFRSYLEARQHLEGYENAPIGFRFTRPGADPTFKSAVERALDDLRSANPDVDIRLDWGE